MIFGLFLSGCSGQTGVVDDPNENEVKHPEINLPDVIGNYYAYISDDIFYTHCGFIDGEEFCIESKKIEYNNDKESRIAYISPSFLSKGDMNKLKQTYLERGTSLSDSGYQGLYQLEPHEFFWFPKKGPFMILTQQKINDEFQSDFNDPVIQRYWNEFHP